MHPGGPFASSTVVDGLINKPGGVCKVLLGCSVIHGCWVWGRKKYELQKWTKKYEKKKKTPHSEVKRNQNKNKSLTQNENKKSNKDGEWRREERWETLPWLWPQGGGSCPLSRSTKSEASIYTAL